MSSREIELEASAWLARLDAGEPAAQLHDAVAAWRAADPRHEVAFLRLRAGWGRMDRAQALRPAAAAGIDPDLFKPVTSPATVEDMQMSGETRAALSNPDLKRRRFLAAAAALLAIGVGIWALSTSREAIYATGLGGFERVQLSDGSIVELNTDTRIRVALGKTARRVELLQGEANFIVKPDAARPFLVTIGDTAVRALGTAFNVRRRSHRAVEVIVTEGKVAIGQPTVVESLRPDVSHSISAPILSAGQAATVAEGHVQLRALESVERERELAWQSGMLLFEGDPLSEVVGEFNRYNQRKLVVADQKLASLKVGGYFKANNLDAFVNVLRRDFGIDAQEERGRIVLSGMGRAN